MSDLNESFPLVRLDTRCCYANGRLILGRVRLFPDWILITGWHALGRYHRRVLLNEVEQVEWLPGNHRYARLRLSLVCGAKVEMLLLGAALWKMALEEQLAFVSAEGFTIRHLNASFYPLPNLPASGDGLIAETSGPYIQDTTVPDTPPSQ